MSSNGGRGAGLGDRDAFDTAIERAVREMLDVEPPPGLRGRVLDRLETGTDRARRMFWLAGVPVAAAAVIILAVMTPWRERAVPESVSAPPTVVAQRETPRVARPDVPQPVVPPAVVAQGTGPESTKIATIVRGNPPRSRPVPPLPDRRVAAAAVEAVEDTNFTTIGALAEPESIAIQRLADPVPSPMRSIEPVPLQIPALQITALPETPRERREE